jgi:hypothetical protein
LIEPTSLRYAHNVGTSLNFYPARFCHGGGKLVFLVNDVYVPVLFGLTMTPEFLALEDSYPSGYF